MGAFGSKQVVKKNKTVVEPIKVNLPNANNYRPQNENLVQMLGQIEDSINNNNMKNCIMNIGGLEKLIQSRYIRYIIINTYMV